MTRRSAYGRASPALQPTCASARFPRGTSLRLRDGVPEWRFSTSRKRASRARHTHHRPAGEIVHEPPQNPRPADGRGQSRLQHQHRSPARCGSPDALADTAAAQSSPARPVGGVLGERDPANVAGHTGVAADHCAARDAAPSRRVFRRSAPHLGAPSPAMAGTTWSGEGRHLPAGTPARSARSVGLHRHCGTRRVDC